MAAGKITVLDGGQPVSKALDEILRSGTIVAVTKDSRYYGIIDDRTIRKDMSDPSKFKCIHAAVRAQGLRKDAETYELMTAFLTGPFKALPVVEKGKVIDSVSRSGAIRRMLKERLVPKVNVEAVMKTPLYTVDMNESLGVAKKVMREKGVHRLAVTRMGRVIGVVSTFDFAMLVLKPKGRDRLGLISEVKKPEEQPVGKFMREKLITVDRSDPLTTSLEKMAKDHVSTLIVADGKKPIGVITAVDAMKFVLSIISAEPEVFVSGLSEETLYYHDNIKGAIKGAINKYTSSFNFDHINVHLKEGKNSYVVNVNMGVDHSPLTVRAEGYDLKATMDEAAAEIKRLLNKKKMYRKQGRRPWAGSI